MSKNNSKKPVTPYAFDLLKERFDGCARRGRIALLEHYGRLSPELYQILCSERRDVISGHMEELPKVMVAPDKPLENDAALRIGNKRKSELQIYKTPCVRHCLGLSCSKCLHGA